MPGVIDHGRSQEGRQRFDLRHVHVLTFAGLPGPVDRGEHPDQAEHAGDRVSGRTAPQHWFAVGIARKVRESRGLLSRVGEADVVPPGAGRSERRERDHHQPRVDLTQRLVAEAELRHDARRVILGEHVGRDQQLPQDLSSARLAQVEREAVFVAVHRIEDRRELICRAVLGRLDGLPGTPETPWIESMRRLDLDDLRSHVAERLSHRRASPELGEVQDAQPAEGAGPAGLIA